MALWGLKGLVDFSFYLNIFNMPFNSLFFCERFLIYKKLLIDFFRTNQN